MKRRSKFAPSKKRVRESPYRGAAGEHLVLGQLLLRSFNAALVEVDSGIDILAEKKGKLSLIQVKLRRLGGKGSSSFVISEKNLRRKIRPNYYIFGLLNERKAQVDYLILPKRKYDSLRKRRLIYHFQKGKSYRAQVISRGGKWYIRNQKNDITGYINNWKLIK